MSAVAGASGSRGGTPGTPEAWGALHAWRKAVEHLAAAYAGHPDYDRSWAV